MTTPVPERSLPDLLRELHACCTSLHEALATEQVMIGRGDIPGLESVAQRKLELLQQTEDLNSRRRGLVTGAELTDDGAGMDALLEQQPDASTAKALWQDVLALLRHGQAMNEASGVAIRRSLEDNQRLIEILHGEEAAPPPAYGPRGTPPTGGGRDLGSA